MDERGDRPTVARLRLGAALKARRLEAGIKGEQAAAAVRSSPSKISRIESGRLPVRQRDVSDLLDLYRVTAPAERDSLLGLAAESARRGWWDAFSGEVPAHILHSLSVESAATRITLYDPMAVPAMLQTPGYTRAVCTRRGQPVPWRGGLRADTLTRRAQLLRDPLGPQLWALIDEGALRRVPPRGGEVMAAQIAQLIQVANTPTVTVQIVPRYHPAALDAAGPFEILRFPDGTDLDDMVLLEHVTNISAVDGLHEVERYRQLFELLAVEAYRQEATLGLLRDMAQSLQHHG